MRKLILCFVYFYVLFFQHAAAYFDTVSEIEAYAATIPLATPNESVDQYHPQYTKLHRTIKSLTENSLVQKMGFRRNRVIKEFNTVIRQITEKRELAGLFGNFVQKFYIENETKWYIWGALHGAFHSLVRGLGALRKVNIIDDNFNILNNSTYLVFNGNIINYGAYQIETLLVLMKLAEKNPLQVIFVKGAFEQEGAWQKTNFKDELITRMGRKKFELDRGKYIGTFFNTFALAIYLISTEADVLRISFYEKHPLLQDTLWEDFLKNKSSGLRKIKYIPKTPWDGHIKALITTHFVQEVPYGIQDIEYAKNDDVNTWTVFSAPLNIFKAYYGFYQDVTVELITSRFFSNWKLSIFNQNPDKLTGFSRSREFDVATGAETFTKDADKRIENLSEKIEFALIEQKELQNACEQQQKNKDHVTQDKP